jgi:peptidoglycan/LPS O-acetylase OafA/YrhL
MLYHGSIFELVSADSWVVSFGWLGVDLFFVLSGFLIAGQLLRPWATGLKPDYRRFFERRLLRTIPAYLSIVALYFTFPALRDRENIQPIWQFLTFTENFGLRPPQTFSQAWSLCVEEQFYLVFPAVVAIIALRPSIAKVIGCVVALLIAGAILRGYVWLHDVAGEPFDINSTVAHPKIYMAMIYYPTWMRLDGLIMGVVTAIVQTFRKGLWQVVTERANLFLLVGLMGIGAAIFFFKDQIPTFWPTVFGYPLVSASMALVVAAGSSNNSVIGRYSVPGAGALATCAYSLYLSHKIVFHVVDEVSSHMPEWAQHIRLVIALLGALVLGALLYWLVERPFLRLRDRLDGPSSPTFSHHRAIE